MPTAFPKLLVICMIPLAFPAAAQVHKWVDDDGRVHYADQPPASRPSQRLTIPAAAIGATAPGCHTIRCQYERLRQDRLLREAEEREKDESRARIAALANLAALALPPAGVGTGTGWLAAPYPFRHGPLFYRRAVIPGPLPGARPLTEAPSPASSIGLANPGRSGLRR
jgi:hypothetical protein